MSEIKAIKHFIPQNKNSVEIGIGSGRFAEPLGIEEGIDPSFEMRKIAQKQGLRVIDAIAEEIPYIKNSFDFVLMVTTICFVNDVDVALTDIYRIIKPKGLLILGFIDKESLLGKEYQKFKEGNIFFSQATFYSTEEVIQLFLEHNFHSIKIIQTLFGNLKDIKTVQKYKRGFGEG